MTFDFEHNPAAFPKTPDAPTAYWFCPECERLARYDFTTDGKEWHYDTDRSDLPGTCDGKPAHVLLLTGRESLDELATKLRNAGWDVQRWTDIDGDYYLRVVTVQEPSDAG